MLKNHPLKSATSEASDIAILAIDIWRLEKKINKVLPLLSEDSSKSLSNTIEKIKLYLQKNKVEVVDFDGIKYDDGLNIDVLSFIDEKRDKPIISETIEPMVKYNGKVFKRAKVIVTK